MVVGAKHLVGASLAALAAVSLSACGSASAPKVAPVKLLAAARKVIDGTYAVHFVLASKGVSSSGTELVSGSGDLARPDELSGSFDLSLKGLPVSVKVVSADGTFYVAPPFLGYEKANPATYGFGNPAQLISPTTGVSALLGDVASNARSDGQERLSGELLDKVTGSVAGSKVPVLPDAEPSKRVALTVAIDPATDQVRQVSLVGPFTSKTSTTIYTVTLSDYGEHVTITAPST